MRTAPGVADSFGTTFCMGSSPKSGCATVTMAFRAAKCGSVNMSRARKMRPAGTPASCRRPSRSSAASVAVQAAMRSSSSAMAAPRAECVANRGSAASSGRSMTAASRVKTVSWFAAISTRSPSPVGYTLLGATLGSTAPVRSRW